MLNILKHLNLEIFVLPWAKNVGSPRAAPVAGLEEKCFALLAFQSSNSHGALRGAKHFEAHSVEKDQCKIDQAFNTRFIGFSGWCSTLFRQYLLSHMPSFDLQFLPGRGR